MKKIWLIDTSIFLEILDIPNKANSPFEIRKEFSEKAENNDEFYIPLATILETGRLISQLNNGDYRRGKAIKFVEYVEAACNEMSPFKLVKFMSSEDMQSWLNEFPDNAMRKISLGDFSIIKDLDEIKNKNPNSTVYIWTLDKHLQGYRK